MPLVGLERWRGGPLEGFMEEGTKLRKDVQGEDGDG